MAHRAAMALYAPLFRWRLQRRRGSARLEPIARAQLAYSTHGRQERQ
jgi:hypothetical protein